jgi:adenylate cyclase
MLGELLPTGGGDPIPLLKPKLSIGRREDCDISLRFPNVSSNHCELELLNGYWRVRDLGSRNGTKVNGARVDSAWVLPGDELSVAKHVYEVKYTAEGAAPPPENEHFLSMSLLERAGLEKAPPNRPRPSAKPTAGEPAVESSNGDRRPGAGSGPQAPAKKKPDSDESIALKWLEAADDE